MKASHRFCVGPLDRESISLCSQRVIRFVSFSILIGMSSSIDFLKNCNRKQKVSRTMSCSWFYVILLVTFLTAFLSLAKAEGKNLDRARRFA